MGLARSMAGTLTGGTAATTALPAVLTPHSRAPILTPRPT